MFSILDNLDSFFNILGKQQDLPVFASDNVFVKNKSVDISCAQQKPNHYLSSNTTEKTYLWTLSGPELNSTTLSKKVFSFNFTNSGEYTLVAKINATFTLNGRNITKNGTFSSTFYIKDPLKNLVLHGNTFVENGSLFHLNVTCGGSPNFVFCHYFSSNSTFVDCFDSHTIVPTCLYSVRRYFPSNVTQYVHIGTRNDVSQINSTVKITVYKGELFFH